MKHNIPNPEFRPEKLVTIKEAAKLTGIHYFKLNRAAKQGLIPTYSLYMQGVRNIDVAAEALEPAHAAG